MTDEATQQAGMQRVRECSMSFRDALYTSAINVRPFAEGLFMMWRGKELGTNLSEFRVTVQESADLEIWNSVGSTFTVAANAEQKGARSFEIEWIRLAIELAAIVPNDPAPAVTSWVVANFVPRKGLGEKSR